MSRKLSWLWSALVALAIVLSPSESFARGGHGGGHGSGRGGTSSGAVRRPNYSSPNARNTYYFPGNAGSAYRGGYVGRGYAPYGNYGRAYGPRPYWGYYAGWGLWPWGYYANGYYPYWGAPPQAQTRTPKTDSYTLFGGGSFTQQGFTPSGSFSYDGQRWGLNFQGDGLIFVPPASAGKNLPDSYMPLVSAHLAYSLASTPHVRWRLEAGGSTVFVPACPCGASAVTYLGPDFGTSAQAALAGPFGLQAAVHYTPMPAKVLDAEANVLLAFGALGVKAGWRVIRLDDRDVRGTGTGALAIFSGPAVSVGLVY